MLFLLFSLILPCQLAEKSDSLSTKSNVVFRVQYPKYWWEVAPLAGDSLLTEISLNKNFIAYYKLRNGVIVDVTFSFFSEFQSRLMQLVFQNLFSEELGELEKGRQGTGLVPVIDLPINFPAPVAGIIGQGGQLDISGSQRIEFGGSRLQNLDYRSTEYSKESWFPQLDMKQHLGVNLKGTIGEKVHVFIDHDSEREFALDNTIRLEYDGDDDEIIQSIKAGNTELSLPGIVLIGGSTPHKGLFGIKSEAKIGSANLTAIASREETENESQSWTGGGTTEREMKIENYDFVKSRFFIVAPPDYVRSLTDPHNITSGNSMLLPKEILAFNVYHGNSTISRVPEAKVGWVFDIPIAGYQNPGFADSTQVKLIIENNAENPFYYLDTVGIGNSRSFTVLELNYSLPNEDIIAIQWIYKDWRDSIYTIGTVDTTRTIPIEHVQTIKRERTEGESDTSHISWWYELKNIYSAGGTNIEMQDIKVFKYADGEGEDLEIDPGSGKQYAQLLGLKNAFGTLGNVFDAARGLIIFPQAFPFVDSALPVRDSIYNTPRWKPEITPNNYYIKVKYRGTSREYVLSSMMDIIEGSEVIKINDEVQTKGTDYLINYRTGELTFITPKADYSNARITADFQYVPFFQPAAKNLFALKGESKIGENGQVSSALMYYSTSSMDYRPRLGSEPKKILLGEVVGSWSVQPEFFTTAVDRLPLIDTQESSNFAISGNAAFSLPDPNSKNEVYLDDMEGVKSSYTLGLNRGDWSFGSVPQDVAGQALPLQNFAQVLWYNLRDGVPAYDLYPDLPDNKRNEKKQVCQLKFQDDAWRYESSISEYWTSLLTCVSPTGMDFSENEYFEVWVKGSAGKLHIDIGTAIPEDGMGRGADGTLKGRGSLQTEDKNHNLTLDLGENEDTGLDGVMGEDGKNILGDEGNDDYKYDTDDPDNYSGVNGTEDNGRFDTEDLDGNGILDAQENYFSTEIDLASSLTDKHFVVKRTNGWTLFRIPLTNFQKINSAQWECIKYARLWIEDISKGEEISIAALDIVGNHWKHTGSDTVKLSVKNTDEDLDYTSPPIERKKDAYGREEREQSLVLKYDALSNNCGGGYTTYSVARSFIEYKTLAFWLRGIGQGDPAQFYIRLGTNSSNYYEYRVNISPNWQEVSLDLESLAQGKLNKRTEDTVYVEGNYRIVGRPSLTNIMRIEAGVVNDSSAQLEGEVWFDELRLVSPRRDAGVASNVTISSKFADLANVSFSYGLRNPYFKSLGTFMSSSDQIATNSQENYSLNGSLALNKVLPASWKISLPLSASLTSSEAVPKYQTGSDIILSEKEAKKQSSRSSQKNIGINFSKSASTNPLLRLSLDNIKCSFNHANGYSNSWTRIDSSLSEQGSLSYGYSPSLPSIKIGKMELRYYPQTISANVSHSYARDKSFQIAEKKIWFIDTLGSVIDTSGRDTFWLVDTVGADFICDTTYIEKLPTEGLNYGYGATYKPINIVQLGYSAGFTKDLLMPRKDKETGMNERASVGVTPSLFGYLSPSANYSANYQELHTLQLDSLRDVGTSNVLSFGLPLNISKFARIVTSLRDESKDSTAGILTSRFLSGLLLATEKFTDNLQIPRLSHSISRSNQTYSLYERPDFDYRAGLKDDPAVSRLPNSNNFAQITRSYGINDVGIQLGNISITSSASLSTTESGRSGQKTISEQTSYPDLLLSFSSLERYVSRLSRTGTSLSAGIKYSIDHSKSGQKTPDSTFFTTFGKNQSYGCNLNTRFKNGARVVLSSDFLKARNETKGVTSSLSETKRINYNLSTSHSFKPPEGMRLPFMTSKVSNNIDGTLTVTFLTDETKNLSMKTKTKDSKSLNITPQISYNFSSSVSGGANATYSQQWNVIGGGGNTRNVGMKFFVEFMF